MSKNTETTMKTVFARPFYGEIEYEMPHAQAKALLDTRKGTEKNLPPQKFLCQIINEQYMVKGNCVKVHII